MKIKITVAVIVVGLILAFKDIVPDKTSQIIQKVYPSIRDSAFESPLPLVDSESGIVPDQNKWSQLETKALAAQTWKPVHPSMWVKTTFPKAYSASIKVVSQGHTAETFALGSNPVPAKITNDGVVYENAFEGCDVFYRSSTLKTEEFIVVKEAKTKSWSWDVQADLEPSLTCGNTIEFKDNNQVPRMRINAPEAKDADGKVLFNKLSLSYTKYGSYIRVTLEADLTGCKTPVVVDPTWSSTGALALARVNYSGVGVNGGVMAIGGDTVAKSCEQYNPASQTWSTVVNSLTPRQGHTSTILSNGKTLVVGGCNYASGFLKTCELYDATSNSWSTTGSITTTRGFHTATLLNDGRVLVTGGHYYSEATSMTTTLNSIEIYNPSTGTWSAGPVLSQVRTMHTATKLSNGKVLIVGGHDNIDNYHATCDLYDPASNTTSATGNMSTVRGGHTANLLSNGKVFVAGGGDGPATAGYLASCELYDPATNSWTLAGNLSVGRGYLRSTVANNKVYVTGGCVNPGTYTSQSVCDAFNVGTSTMEAMATLITARDQHEISLAGNKVIVAGGKSMQTRSALTSCEVLDVTPPMTLMRLSPPSNHKGGFAGNLYVYGSQFTSGSVVMWNNQARETKFISDSVIKAEILPDDIAEIASIPVTVVDNGVTAGPLTFTVTAMVGEKGDTGLKGDAGLKGDVGEKGEKGEKGDIGSTGPAGRDGIDGKDGINGLKGDKGDTGEKGEKGDKGDTGLKGDKGDVGLNGKDGSNGNNGNDGLNGKDGVNGIDGKNGIDGVNGKDGINGKDGVNGIDGLKGEKGDCGKDGVNGKDGVDGKNGVDGKDGINGKDGLNGEKGEKGEKGDKGDKGDTGESASEEKARLKAEKKAKSNNDKKSGNGDDQNGNFPTGDHSKDNHGATGSGNACNKSIKK